MKRLPAMLLAAVVVAADLVTKSLAFAPGTLGKTEWIFPEWLGITCVMNPGVTGGLLSSLDARIITVLTLAAAIAVAVYTLRARLPGRLTLIGLALILGGALGNLYDRIRFGQVRDFIDLRPGLGGIPWLDRWPTFNLADSAIVVGVVLLIVHSLFFAKRETGDAPKEAGGA